MPIDQETLERIRRNWGQLPPQKYTPCVLDFKGKGCRYVGPYVTCNGSQEHCIARDNLKHFQGHPLRPGIKPVGRTYFVGQFAEDDPKEQP